MSVFFHGIAWSRFQIRSEPNGELNLRLRAPQTAAVLVLPLNELTVDWKYLSLLLDCPVQPYSEEVAALKGDGSDVSTVSDACGFDIQ